MKEIIDRILAAEAEGGRAVAEARSRGEAVLAAARAEELLAAAARARAERLERRRRELEAVISGRSGRRAEAAREAARLVLGAGRGAWTESRT